MTRFFKVRVNRFGEIFPPLLKCFYNFFYLSPGGQRVREGSKTRVFQAHSVEIGGFHGTLEPPHIRPWYYERTPESKGQLWSGLRLHIKQFNHILNNKENFRNSKRSNSTPGLLILLECLKARRDCFLKLNKSIIIEMYWRFSRKVLLLKHCCKWIMDRWEGGTMELYNIPHPPPL